MKLVFIIGSGSVGKMTVGQELSKITELRLFHNHMTIEPILELFDDFNVGAISKVRDVIFEEFAKSDNYGMIFTFIWAFDQVSDWNYINKVMDIFKEYNTEFYFVELIASLETRLKRNNTENRKLNKKSKSDVNFSKKLILDEEKNYRLISEEGEIPYPNYLRINNETIEPQDVAKFIKKHFKFI